MKFENMPLLESKVIIDKSGAHFILMDMGWSNLGLIHRWVFHFELKGGKVYLHKNMTDFDIVNELTENGIDEKDFVFTILEEPKDLENLQLEEAA